MSPTDTGLLIKQIYIYFFFRANIRQKSHTHTSY